MKKLQSALSAILVTGTVMSSTVHAAPYNGWKAQGKSSYYYVNGIKVKGLYAVKNRYYYFGANGLLKRVLKK